jgi:hypothetical protein
MILPPTTTRTFARDRVIEDAKVPRIVAGRKPRWRTTRIVEVGAGGDGTDIIDNERAEDNSPGPTGMELA